MEPGRRFGDGPRVAGRLATPGRRAVRRGPGDGRLGSGYRTGALAGRSRVAVPDHPQSRCRLPPAKPVPGAAFRDDPISASRSSSSPRRRPPPARSPSSCPIPARTPCRSVGSGGSPFPSPAVDGPCPCSDGLATALAASSSPSRRRHQCKLVTRTGPGRHSGRRGYERRPWRRPGQLEPDRRLQLRDPAVALLTRAGLVLLAP